ncbi:MAG TPA: metallophosphoesterase family protein [Acidimicrobiales bacterium]
MTTRIGLVADSHSDLCDWPAVLETVRAALGPVDLVLHCGDITASEALDDLETIAPVRATRSEGDPPAAPPRLVEGPTVVDVGGRAIALAFARPDAAPDGVAAVVFGGTHAASVETIDGVLWVNPGSPSLSKARSVAVLTLDDDGRAQADVIAL